jgi:hypothetical protein
MNDRVTLLQPSDRALLLIDFQAGLAFGVESISRQVVLNNAVALARTAVKSSQPSRPRRIAVLCFLLCMRFSPTCTPSNAAI